MERGGKSRELERAGKSRQSLGQIKTVASRESHYSLKVGGNLVSPDFMSPRARTPSVDIFINHTSKSKKFGYSIPNLREQRRRKFGSRLNIEIEPKIPPSGLSTPGLTTGILAALGREKSAKPRLPSPRGNNHVSSTSLAFCLSLIFAASITQITVASHNLHSFKKSGTYHKSCLNRYGGIWFGQELWLSEKQLPMLQQLQTQFVARSGMEDAVSSGILSGRPFGGVSVAWSPDLDHLISPISNFRHKRVVGVELKAEDGNFLLLNVYMPFLDSSNRASCMAETIDTLGMIETIIEQFPNNSIIIGGDMNTEFKGHSPFDSLWSDVMTKFNLSSCDNSFPSTTTTYHHNSLGHKKWNDHFLVSRQLMESTSLSNHEAIDEGDNLSDHFPILMSLNAKFRQIPDEGPQPSFKRQLKWANLSESHKDSYTQRLQSILNPHHPPAALFCEKICRCQDAQCQVAIQNEYDFLTSSLKQADSSLPRFKPGIQKDWWTDGLSELRDKSIEIQRAWIAEGRPRQGPIHDERLRIRAAYKQAIRAAQRAPMQATWDRLHSSLADNDTNSFWRSWKKIYNKNKSHLPPVVEGCSSGKAIADCFKNSFEKNSTPNNDESVEKLNLLFSERYDAYVMNHESHCNCDSYLVTPSNVIDALICMKDGKSADENEISAEHLHNAPLTMLVRLSTMFNMMLKHSYIPHQFRRGFMIPLVKDHSGNHSSTNNYRGITISPIISKLFEHILKLIFFESLATNEHQFGFKKKSSTVHALHCLKSTVNHYVTNGSRVFCTFLDASKAFDRLVHSGLFLKLMDKNVPLMFLDIIKSWYSDLSCRVKWGEHFSDWFKISAGVRQGGVLSPDLYCLYVDNLICQLKRVNKGCHYFNRFAAAFFYADDMCVLAPSIKGLETMLKLCEAYCIEWDIGLNAKKSRNLYFGKSTTVDYDIFLNGNKVEWADEWSYLGVTLKSGKVFSCSVKERIKKFYRCLNSILRIDGRSNDMVMLRLIETHCTPLLTYAIEIVHVINRDDRRQLRVAYNSTFRKIFGYRSSQSVTNLQSFLSRPTWEELVERRKNHFFERLIFNGGDSLARATIM